jgi:hypothetical protein
MGVVCEALVMSTVGGGRVVAEPVVGMAVSGSVPAPLGAPLTPHAVRTSTTPAIQSLVKVRIVSFLFCYAVMEQQLSLSSQH